MIDRILWDLIFFFDLDGGSDVTLWTHEDTK